MSGNNDNSSTSNLMKFALAATFGAVYAIVEHFLWRETGQKETKQQYAQDVTPKADDENISKECDICNENFKQLMNRGEEIHSTPCGHLFCQKCIDTSLRRYARCPLCNEQLLPSSNFF